MQPVLPVPRMRTISPVLSQAPGYSAIAAMMVDTVRAGVLPEIMPGHDFLALFAGIDPGIRYGAHIPGEIAGAIDGIKANATGYF